MGVKTEILVEPQKQFDVRELNSGKLNSHIIKIRLDKAQLIEKNINDREFLKKILLEQFKNYCFKCKYDIDDRYPITFEEDEKEYRVIGVAKQKGSIPPHLKRIKFPLSLNYEENQGQTRNNP